MHYVARWYESDLCTQNKRVALLSCTMASALSTAICRGQWELCIRLVRGDVETAKAFASKPGSLVSGPHMFRDIQGLPLHEAVAVGAPVTVIDAIARAYPTALTKKELVKKRLPIHLACIRQPIDNKTIQLLAKYYQKGLAEADRNGKVALHYAMQKRGSEALIKFLLHNKPNAAKAQDKKGLIPLHIACSLGASTKLIKLLLELNPDGSVMVTADGMNALELCQRCNPPNREEVTELILEYKRKVDEQFRLAAQPSSRRLIV